jgi:NodT family efflux transporter outer membrane factor (OMF) lipoprotein
MALTLCHSGCFRPRHWWTEALRGPRRVLAGMLALASLAGCAVGPDFKPPELPAVAGYLPGHDRQAGRIFVPGGDIPARWWEAFRSRHLNELIQSGIAHNADLQAAEAAVRVAQANALAERGSLFPQVAANWNSSPQKTPIAALQSNAANNAETYALHTGQVTVAYVLDAWGGTRRQIETLEAQAEALAFQREAVYLTLTSNIALAAIQEASLRGQIAATRRLIGLQSRLLENLRRQHNLGQIGMQDVLVQETAEAQARMLLPPLQRQLDQQRHLLAVLTGRFPSEEMVATFELGSFRLPRRLPLSLPADLVCQRPDVRAAEANVHAANAQVGVAIANRLPQITLSGNDGSTALAITKLFSTGTNGWLMAANVVQPVFDGGTLRHKQQAAEEAWMQSVQQYRSVVLTAFQNVADTLRALQADARALSAATAAEQAAQRSFDLVRRQLERGQVSLPILLGAQQAYLQTSLARVQAEAARLADTVALFQALGGGWWNRWEATIMASE